MPKVDWDNVEEAQDFAPVPKGTYQIEVTVVEKTFTTNGDEMWNLTGMINNAGHIGRYIFDRIVFSEKALARAKLIFSALGIKTSGSMNMEPQMILHRQAVVDVEVRQAKNEDGSPKFNDDGTPRMRNEITYAGWHPLTTVGVPGIGSILPQGSIAQPVHKEEEIPF